MSERKVTSTLRRQNENRKRTIVLLVLVALLLCGHIIWCLGHHNGEPTVAPVSQYCGICHELEANCTCAQRIEALEAELDEKDEQIAELESAAQNNEPIYWETEHTCSVCYELESECTCAQLISDLQDEIASQDNTPVYLDVEQTCSVCYELESECVCAQWISDLQGEVASKEEQIVELEEQLDNAESSDTDYGSWNECINCPVHCNCAHVSTTLTDYWTQEIIGTEDECVWEIHVVTITCDECGEVLEAVWETELNTQHYYGNDDTCDTCGWTKKEEAPKPTPKPQTPSKPQCSHNNTTTTTHYGDWEKVGTENTCRERLVTETVICKDCGKNVDERSYDEFDYTHNFGSDKTCDDCGWKKEAASQPTAKPTTKPTTKPQCTHKNTTENVSYGAWEKVGTEKDCRRRLCVEMVICTDCNLVLDESSDYDYDHNHSYEGRTCTKCGYKRPASSDVVVEDDSIGTPSNEWEYEDDGELPDPVG